MGKHYNSKLPDTPWHYEYAKKEENDPRRHKARCIHNKDKICQSTFSPYFLTKCGGSAHCRAYAETQHEYERKIDSLKTAEQEEREVKEKYLAYLSNMKSKVVKSDSGYKFRPLKDIKRCLVCDECIVKVTKGLTKCSFCGMLYADYNHLTDKSVVEIMKDSDVFITNIPKKNTPSVKHDKNKRAVIFEKCIYKNGSGKCTNEESKYYSLRCDIKSCGKKRI